MPISQQEKEQIIQQTKSMPLYSKSVLDQTTKTRRLYDHYCDEMHIDSNERFPITRELGDGFFLWVQSTKKYTPKSMRDVLLSGLTRLNMAIKEQLIDPYVMAVMRQRIRTFMRDPDSKESRGPNEALIPDDLHRMIGTMDPRDPSTATIASLLLFGFATAARGSTCRFVSVEDFRHYEQLREDSGIVTVRLRHVKQHPSEKIELAISGTLNTPSTLDVLYWLNRRILDLTGLPLSVIAGNTSLPPQIKQKLLWDFPTDNMTMFIKRRMKWAGLPTEKIGMHSLRHGFLSAAKIAQHPSNTHASITEEAAMYAIWDHNSPTEFGYMTNDTRSLYPVTNFTGLTDTPVKRREASFVPVGEQSVHINSVQFHKLSEEPPPLYYNPSHSYGLKQVRLLLNEMIYVPGSSERANKLFMQRQWTYLLQEAGRAAWNQAQTSDSEMISLKETIAARGGLPPEEVESPNFRKLGALVIDDEIWKADNHYSYIAQKMKDQLTVAGRLLEKLPEPKAPSDFVVKGDPRERIVRRDGRCVRVRRDWALEEERIFIDSLRNRLTATECAERLMIRTPDHVLSHLYVLNKRRAKRGKQPLRFRSSRNKKKSADDSDQVLDLSSSELIDPQQQHTADSSVDLLPGQLSEPSPSDRDTSSSDEDEQIQSNKQQNVAPPLPHFTTVPPYSLPQILITLSTPAVTTTSPSQNTDLTTLTTTTTVSAYSPTTQSPPIPSAPDSLLTPSNITSSIISHHSSLTPFHLPSPFPPLQPDPSSTSNSILSLSLSNPVDSTSTPHLPSPQLETNTTSPEVAQPFDDIIPTVQTPVLHIDSTIELALSPSHPPITSPPMTLSKDCLDIQKERKQSPHLAQLSPSLEKDKKPCSYIDQHISLHSSAHANYRYKRSSRGDRQRGRSCASSSPSTSSHHSSSSSHSTSFSHHRIRSPSRSITPQFKHKHKHKHDSRDPHVSPKSDSRSRSRDRYRSSSKRYSPRRTHHHRYHSPCGRSHYHHSHRRSRDRSYSSTYHTQIHH